MKVWRVIATYRDFTEVTVALPNDMDEAQRIGHAVATAEPVIRCHIRPVDLPPNQIAAFWLEVGRSNAYNGQDCFAALAPSIFRKHYLRGFDIGLTQRTLNG